MLPSTVHASFIHQQHYQTKLAKLNHSNVGKNLRISAMCCRAYSFEPYCNHEGKLQILKKKLGYIWYKMWHIFFLSFFQKLENILFVHSLKRKLNNKWESFKRSGKSLKNSDYTVELSCAEHFIIFCHACIYNIHN